MKSKSYLNFWKRIHEHAKGRAFPLRVMFELTYRCNFRCRHCYVPFSYRKKPELKTGKVFSILDQLAEIGCFYLGFTGGEPFMRRDIMDILRYAKRKGFELIIYTNGSLIDREKAEELTQLKPNKVDITIPALAQNAFEKITQNRGSHKRVFRTIELLRQRHIPLGFKTCVLKENEDEIGDIQKFAQSLNAFHRLDDMLSRRLDGSGEPYRYRGRKEVSEFESFRVREFRNREEKIEDYDLIGIKKEEANQKNLFECGVGVSQAAITPQGEFKPCLMIDEPRYKIVVSRKSQVASLKEGWKSLREFIASVKPDENYKCQNCRLKIFCKWCPAKSWLYKRNFTSCEQESKKWAEIRKMEVNVE